MSEFDELWEWTAKRRGGENRLVQDKTELQYIFNAMKECDCQSFLEVGAAEMSTTYVLSHAMKKGSKIVCVDFGESHTMPYQDDVINRLKDNYDITILRGNSHDRDIIAKAKAMGPYDCGLIDACHKYEDVLMDATEYGEMMNKYVFFHDYQLPGVRKAFDEYCYRYKQAENSFFINSNKYGFGILKVMA